MDNEKFDTSGSGDKDEVTSGEIIGNIDLDALAQILIQGDKKLKPTQKVLTNQKPLFQSLILADYKRSSNNYKDDKYENKKAN